MTEGAPAGRQLLVAGGGPVGLFAAVFLGSVISAFNGGLHSVSTMFSIDLYRGWLRPGASDHEMVRAGKLFSVVVVFVIVIVAAVIVVVVAVVVIIVLVVVVIVVAVVVVVVAVIVIVAGTVV